MSLTKSLEQLKYTRPLFENLSTGKHLDMLEDTTLWNALDGEYGESYKELFAHLGQTIIIDQRGFAYLEYEDSDTKITRDLSLVFLLIFQTQADAGKELNRFDTWLLDNTFFNELREKHYDLLRSEKMEDDNNWKKHLKKAVNLGFMAQEESEYRLLQATWRFLDIFNELNLEQLELSQEVEEYDENNEEEI